MKIVQLITRMDEPGGAQIHVRDLAIRLKHIGHDVILFSGSAETAFPELQQQEITHTRVKHLIREIHLIYDMKALIELRRALKAMKPDLLALHSSKAGLIGRVAGWSLGIPTVLTAHGWAFTEGVSRKKRWIYSILEKFAGFISTGIVSVSHYDRQLAINNKVIAEKKIRVIQNGVPDIERRKLAAPHINPVNMIMVARFAEPKDYQTLVEVLSKLKTKEWKIHFVGEGPLKRDIELEVDKRGLSERVTFLGKRDDVPEILANSQIFILLSKWEGLPLSIIEAMRSGLPVIASNVGGVSELVQNGKSGFLIEKGDKEGLLEKITQLIDQPMLRKQFGQSGRMIYIENFTIERMVDDTLTFYQQVVSKI
ncbi:glycosyltransferase family 4 protein [Heyndrickxia vini]|uniref:Glycosyltransferase family 4 protein n=1 Tax=Heyndrickxia vini TaxID=1476025 RepID=A0ABX7DX16_9BACI|nr:glycosyltransferase family 4 protein [Heyndrickxia vini]QQZ07862.1 glycosyltransferase family 4 protein [Heyndrickxia vini]